MPIVIEGQKNLEFMKRMATSHMTICASKCLHSHNEDDYARFDAEMKEAEQMVIIADSQLQMIKKTEDG